MRVAYAGQRTSTGQAAAYPIAHGTEDGWSSFARRDETEEPDPRARFRAGDFMDGLKDALFGDPSFDLDAFDPETDIARVRANALAPVYEANDPDIADFTAHGGKLLLWHGLYDPGVSPIATVAYYERVLAETEAADESVRLFLAPGVGHCRGGPGANTFDTISALEAWVEDGVAPATIPARNEETGLAWPLCPSPALPRGRTNADGTTTYVCE